LWIKQTTFLKHCQQYCTTVAELLELQPIETKIALSPQHAAFCVVVVLVVVG
jgi:hypothetical protein